MAWLPLPTVATVVLLVLSPCWRVFVLAQSSTCFNPDGTGTLRQGYKPCTANDGGSSTHCCDQDGVCLTNGLCFYKVCSPESAFTFSLSMGFFVRRYMSMHSQRRNGTCGSFFLVSLLSSGIVRSTRDSAPTRLGPTDHVSRDVSTTIIASTI